MFATIGSAHAGTVLSIDLGTAAQSPFTLWNVGGDGTGMRSTTFSISDLVSVPGGTLTAEIGGGSDATNIANDTGAINTRPRANAPANNGSFTQSNLLTDRVVTTAGAGTGLFLQLSGFAPDTTFSIQVWGYDTQTAPSFGAKPGNFSLYDRTNGADTLLGSFTSVAGSLPTDNNSFSVTGNVTSDANGVIMVESLSNIDGSGIMNGFVVSTVPEPMSAFLLLGGLGIVTLRRRRTAL
ncbi:PEP-CTERM sorting domain-containing protein [Chthoniobacter flavus]|uniref:PEP-CTERM sorting domain-containing protein n=1 Tax=Chthoniobacter flavus TaxID=191863 RepID=UPI00104C3D6C|nr:PEP-CTERM sorting domain-containing protein [Chthoniobacter flavus]